MESTTSEETNVENKQEEPVQEGEPEQRKRGYSEVTPGESEPKEEPGQTQNKRQRTEGKLHSHSWSCSLADSSPQMLVTPSEFLSVTTGRLGY